jgi:hypothetical protein
LSYVVIMEGWNFQQLMQSPADRFRVRRSHCWSRRSLSFYPGNDVCIWLWPEQSLNTCNNNARTITFLCCESAQLELYKHIFEQNAVLQKELYG